MRQAVVGCFKSLFGGSFSLGARGYNGFMEYPKNVRLALDILKDEAGGDIASALSKMAPDYSMTWMYKSGQNLFPVSRPDVTADMKEAYRIKGRTYEIKNTAEGDGVVMVELVESYPDPETGAIHRTPLVLVLELTDGKIRTGRHYCDPGISRLDLSPEEVEKAYQKSPTKLVIGERKG
jgi:ketosteroid isomerase-like protein